MWAGVASWAGLVWSGFAAPGWAQVNGAAQVKIEGRGVAELAADLREGRESAEALVQAYLDRIARIDRAGPRLQSVLAVNPDAVGDARTLDKERAAKGVRGPLHGIPILVKDNIETLGPLPTTAGSLALAKNVSERDAPVIARLRAAGAVILGKTNLSEWANMRGAGSISGWSAVGGLTRNPYALDRSVCGSSSGSGAAVAAGLAAAAIGTETDGSVTCPASVNGIVGLKPTVGLVSRTHVVPISHSQDTPGPMARSVRDAAMLLNAMAGSDPLDQATAQADSHVTDYTKGLDGQALAGKRIGVMRFAAALDRGTGAVFAHALEVLQAAGATLVDIDSLPGFEAIGDAETFVLLTELKTDMAAYLASTPKAVEARSLADLIAFNLAHHDQELSMFGQELFEKGDATKGLQDPAYVTALATSRRLAGAEGIDRLLAADKLDALVAPTTGPAWLIDTVDGDHASGEASTLPAVAGYPHLSVPMGLVSGLPVGLSIIGPAWSEARILAFGYAFEQKLGLHQMPAFAASVAAPGVLITPAPAH